MTSLKFGYCVPIFAQPGDPWFRTPNLARLDVASALALAREADALGYDSLWVADHLMLGRDDAIMEAWTTLAALAGSTRRAKLGIIHQAHFFRHPAVAAKMIATLDQIAGGERFIYFIDTGTRAAEHHAYGIDYPDTMEERMPWLLEGLEAARALWASSVEAPANFDGQYYKLRDAVCAPPPVRPPPIWFGEAHPLTLAACARHAQGWNSVPAAPDELRRRLQALQEACIAAGRDFAEIEKSLEIQILIAPDDDAVRQTLADILALRGDAGTTPRIEAVEAYVRGTAKDIPSVLTDTCLIGTPDAVTLQLQRFIELGFAHFMLWFMDAPSSAGLRLFNQQVAHALRSG